MSTAPKHIVAFSIGAWGHTRPLINLSARLAKLRDVNVTILSTDGFHERAVAELARSFTPAESEIARRVRVVSIGQNEALNFDTIAAQFTPIWERLAAGQSVTCRKTGTLHDAVRKPDAVIIDAFATEPVRVIRRSSVGDAVKIYTWLPGATTAFFYLFGPEELGGRGSLITKIENEVKKSGRSFEDVCLDLAVTPKGNVVKVPGLPPMYDYEYYPQEFPLPREMAIAVFPHVFDTLNTSAGAFLITAEPYEPDAVAAMKGWYAASGRHAYVCGPLLPPRSSVAVEKEKQQSAQGTKIQEFLDSTLKTSGEKSLLYISFGSVFWPFSAPEKMWVFLEVVMERNIPFILSHASPLAAIPDDIKTKVEAYGKGCLSTWTPQQTILEHPATGWFVCHGGHNGVIESISAGVPLILWPFYADQPLNAAHITDKLQVGYELIEVRTGASGLHPIYRNGRKPVGTIEALKTEVHEILAKAYGPDGEEKRKRLATLSNSVNHEWEEGGGALRDVQTFLDTL
ncbi:UDP-Glycosyltransferase/glycogen phosphorylase [Trametes polyzona]|nr:UDP-Glycosyltransferase/glycogen phosphorylase [Trametes polyzona]